MVAISSLSQPRQSTCRRLQVVHVWSFPISRLFSCFLVCTGLWDKADDIDAAAQWFWFLESLCGLFLNYKVRCLPLLSTCLVFSLPYLCHVLFVHSSAAWVSFGPLSCDRAVFSQRSHHETVMPAGCLVKYSVCVCPLSSSLPVLYSFALNLLCHQACDSIAEYVFDFLCIAFDPLYWIPFDPLFDPLCNDSVVSSGMHHLLCEANDSVVSAAVNLVCYASLVLFLSTRYDLWMLQFWTKKLCSRAANSQTIFSDKVVIFSSHKCEMSKGPELRCEHPIPLRKGHTVPSLLQ